MSEEQNETTSRIARIETVLTADSRWLWLLFACAFVVKLLYVIQSAGDLRVTVPIMDSEYYYNMAIDIMTGRVVRPEAFFMGPLYPYTLAIVFSVFGKSILAARLVQMIGGAVAVVLVYLIGKQVFRPLTALVGALLLLLYGAATFFEGQLLMMWLGTLLNLTALFMLYRSRNQSGLTRYAIVGVLFGLSALARANILLFVPVVLVWLIALSGGRKRWLRATVLLGATLLTILPATLHNYVASRDFVPITANGGVNFYVGNSNEATGIFYPPKGINLVTDDAVKKYVERLLGRELTPSQLSRYWYGEAFRDMAAHPVREVKLLLKKTAMYFNGYEVPQIESFEVARREQVMLRILFVNFWMLISLALMGMVFLLKEWRKYFLLYGYVLAFALSIILFFVTARYRAQTAPILALFAAHALVVVLPNAIRNARRQILPLALFAGLILVTRPGIFALAADDVIWREHTHQARRFSKLGEQEKAIEEIDKAVELHPDYVDSYIQRAVIYKEGGNLFKAVSDYAKAVELRPDLPSVQYDFGQTLRQLRMYEPATEAYQRAIDLNPTMLEAYNNLGITYGELKQYEKAIEYFNKVVEMDPNYTKAYNNLGAVYGQLGEVDQAIDAFSRAIAVDPHYANSYKNLAMAYVQKTDVPRAMAALEKYLEILPTDRSAQELYGKLRSVAESDTTGAAP